MFAGGGVNRGDRPQIMGEPHLCIKGGASAITGPRISPTIGLKISPEIKAYIHLQSRFGLCLGLKFV